MEKVEVYLKTEPGGEYGLGETEKDELIDYGFDFETKEFEDEYEFINYVYDYNNIVSAYGCVTYSKDKYDIGNIFENLREKDIDWSKINLNVIEYDYKEELYKEKDRYFVQFSAPSKYIMEFELNVDVDNFKPELLTITLKHFSLPVKDSYGEIKDFYIIDELIYDGEDYDDVVDSLIDRGYVYEVSIIKTYEKNGKIDWELIYQTEYDD